MMYVDGRSVGNVKDCLIEILISCCYWQEKMTRFTLPLKLLLVCLNKIIAAELRWCKRSAPKSGALGTHVVTWRVEFSLRILLLFVFLFLPCHYSMTLLVTTLLTNDPSLQKQIHLLLELDIRGLLYSLCRSSLLNTAGTRRGQYSISYNLFDLLFSPSVYIRAKLLRYYMSCILAAYLLSTPLHHLTLCCHDARS